MGRRSHSWFEDAKDYDVVREIVGAHPNYPATYDEWLKLATKQISRMEASGWAVNKVVIKAKEFIRFCDRKGVNRDAATLGLFVVAKAHGQNY